MIKFAMALALITTASADDLSCGIPMNSVVLRNPAGYTEAMFGLPTIAVQKGRRHQVTVRFEADIPRDDLSRVRRIVVFERVALSGCDRDLCWREIARFTSREGVTQVRTIRPKASEIVVASWHVAQKDSNVTGAASAAGCSAGPAVQSRGAVITLKLPSPFGEQIVTLQRL